jgi:hypothetical protein
MKVCRGPWKQEKRLRGAEFWLGWVGYWWGSNWGTGATRAATPRRIHKTHSTAPQSTKLDRKILMASESFYSFFHEPFAEVKSCGQSLRQNHMTGVYWTFSKFYAYVLLLSFSRKRPLLSSKCLIFFFRKLSRRRALILEGFKTFN